VSDPAAGYINLALPLFAFSEPAPPIRVSRTLDYKMQAAQSVVLSVWLRRAAEF
jgi:hypothetical protein